MPLHLHSLPQPTNGTDVHMNHKRTHLHAHILCSENHAVYTDSHTRTFRKASLPWLFRSSTSDRALDDAMVALDCLKRIVNVSCTTMHITC